MTDTQRLEEAIDDLHRAAQLLQEAADQAACDDHYSLHDDLVLFVQHIRREWDR